LASAAALTFVDDPVAARVLVVSACRLLRRQGLRGMACGAITLVQRFGSALRLNAPFHVRLRPPTSTAPYPPPKYPATTTSATARGRRVIALLERALGPSPGAFVRADVGFAPNRCVEAAVTVEVRRSCSRDVCVSQVHRCIREVALWDDVDAILEEHLCVDCTVSDRRDTPELV
jgi:hypothetical protein